MTKDKNKESQKKSSLTIKAESRKLYGRKVKKLREQNVLPANLYGKDVKSQALKVDLKAFLEMYKKAGETNVVDLIIDKKKTPYKILFHNLQTHPVDDKPLHIDFHKIDLTKTVQVAIPIELVNEAPGVLKGGVVVQTLSEIEVEALPNNLPNKFIVDLTKLKEIGDAITVKDLSIDKDKVKILIEDENQLIVNLKTPKEEEEEQPEEKEEKAEAEEEKEEKEEKEEEKQPDKTKTEEPSSKESKPKSKEKEMDK